MTYVNFSHLQSTSHLMQYTYQDVSSTAQQFLNSTTLMPFSASSVFCFTSSMSARDFSSRETKSHSCAKRIGHGVIPFLVKNHWPFSLVLSIMRWTNLLKEYLKKFSEANAASHNTSWCTDTDGFPEHSPSGSLHYKGPTVQKIILLF